MVFVFTGGALPLRLERKRTFPKSELLIDEIFATTEKYEDSSMRHGPKK
jgi:hypothetical protein